MFSCKAIVTEFTHLSPEFQYIKSTFICDVVSQMSVNKIDYFIFILVIDLSIISDVV